jgi:uncharacterized protein with ParB-like and HNH nuclease domain
MKIESQDRTVEKLLNSGYFKVPRFQRPYSWERAEVEDFWNDTIADADSEYFIGSIVLFSHSPGTLGIVDGQQRLTTITMFLCALRDAFAKEGFDGLAKGLHRLIERPDINDNDLFVLQTETSYPYLQQRIQSFKKQDEKIQAGEEEKRLEVAFELLEDSIAESVDAVRSNPSLSDEKKRAGIRNGLIGLRDRILGLKTIMVSLESEDDAYVIFETLNTRGRDLTVSDLVRTHITRLLPQANKNVDRSKERFNAVVSAFAASREDLSVNSFLHHYWLSKYEYTTEKKLYRALKRTIKTKKDAATFLNDFESDAVLYRQIHEPDTRPWKNEERVVRGSLRALMLFRVRQQLPFVLAVLREYCAGNLNLRNTRRAVLAVENFHFIFTAVTSQRSSGGISFMYALHARQLDAAKSEGKKVKEINALITKLRAKLPPYEEFEANFREILASEKYTKRKSLATYILRRMSRELGNFNIDKSSATLEHLANQSGGNGPLSDEELAEIGNLVLVDEKLNKKLGNKSFGQKMSILKQSPVWLDDFLRKQSSWNAAKIRDRSHEFAKMAFNKVWRV